MEQRIRHGWIWLVLLVVLIASNILLRWPGRPEDSAQSLGPPGGADPEAFARVNEVLDQLPAARREEIRAGMQENMAFLETLKNVAPDERGRALAEYLAKHPVPRELAAVLPPPPGVGSGDGPGAPRGAGGGEGAVGPGQATAAGRPSGPPPGGGPETGRVPAPAERYSMDQHIAQQQEAPKP